MTSRELFIKELSLYDRASDGHDEFYAHLPYVKDYDLVQLAATSYAQWQYYQSPPVQGKSSGHY